MACQAWALWCRMHAGEVARSRTMEDLCHCGVLCAAERDGRVLLAASTSTECTGKMRDAWVRETQRITLSVLPAL